MAEIVNISYIGPGVEAQNYSAKDDSLITNSYIYTQFGDPNDYVELFIYDQNNTLLDKVYNATSYKPGNSQNPTTGLHNQIVLDPQGDLTARGYDRGTLSIQYNFHRNLFNSAYGQFYWIKEVSQTRTELKISSQNISNTDILNGYQQYQAYAAGLSYYNDFYLNFGNNNIIIAVNVAYTEDAEGSYLLVKLYEPLPSDFDVKDQLWIVEKIAEPVTYEVDIQVEAAAVVEQNVLRGPNYNVDTKQQTGQSTPYYSYQSIINTPVSSSFQKMMSYYQDKSVAINVDFSDFSNFIHFSSATDRVQNFASKVASIETYTTQIKQQLAIAGGMGSPAVSASVITLQNTIDGIITNFDTYEYFLYYESASFAWPKSTTTQPYLLYSVTSSQAINWLGSTDIIPSPGTASVLFSASYYDNTNKDLLSNVVPMYIQDDSSNQPYITFVNMVAQNFDNVWIYYKDVTNRFEATNNPVTGISPDLVADALINLGLTLYTNSNISDNLYYSLFGLNADGSLLPPTGSEHISSYVTSSLTTLPADTIQKELYKRLYHNIPYLYKTKGTRESIKALTNIFGVPDSILKINEFGGYSRYSSDGVDEINNIKVTGSGTVLELSASILSPYTTVQYYDNEDRLNSRNLEFGFSPADDLNATITGSLGYFNIDQYIGNPAYEYSSSYTGLDSLKSVVFSGSSYTHNIYEYIRLLKYYNNTLFKLVQDFVPARADLSTGLIVKSHILERNKYQRNEPEVDIDSNFSQSIDLVEVSGTDPGEIPFSTANTTYSKFAVIPEYYPSGANFTYGPVTVNNTYGWEKYTGEFGGAEIQADYSNFDQVEYSSYTIPSYGPCYRYTASWLPSGGGETGSYIDCYTGGPVISYFPDGGSTTLYTGCAQSGSIRVIGSTPTITQGGQCAPNIHSLFVGQDQGALYNNVTSSVLSNKMIEAEYSYGLGAPVNLSSIISQSSCEGCNRTYCFNYLLTNTGTTNEFYTYQDCNNQTYTNTLYSGSAITFCGKLETLNFIGNPSFSSYTLIAGGVCGSTYSNTDLCYKVTVHALDPTTYSYTDCYGTIRSVSLTSDASGSDCMRYGTVNTSNDSSEYYITIDGYCQDVCKKTAWSTSTYTGQQITASLCNGSVLHTGPVPVITPSSYYCVRSGSVVINGSGVTTYTGLDCSTYYCRNYTLHNTDTFGVRAVPYSYTDCSGNPVSASVPHGQTVSFCGLSNTFSVPPVSGYPPAPGYVYDLRQTDCIKFADKCDYLYYANVTTNYIPWTASFIDCAGTPKVVSDSYGYFVAGIGQCIRSGSLQLYNLNNPFIATGSNGFCGYYSNQIEYTGSRTLAEIQDYNYYLQSSVNSRYNGAKSISAKYNVFTPGDDSYGTSPAMDYYVDYTGLFTSVESSSYFPDQLVVKMSYMVDISGGLQDLNLQNNNWVYFQNMYKPGDQVTIKQFNATQYSNQKNLDKNRAIIDSGWGYRPYYYRETASLQYSECFSTNLSAEGVGADSTFSQIGSPVSGAIKFSGSSVPNNNQILNYRTIASASLYWVSLYESSSMAISDAGNNLYSYHSASSGLTNVFITGSYYSASIDGWYTINANIPLVNHNPIPTSSLNDFTLYIINGATGSHGFPYGTIIASSSITIDQGDNNTENLSIYNVPFYANAGDKLFYSLVTDYNNPYPNVTGSYTIPGGASYNCYYVTFSFSPYPNPPHPPYSAGVYSYMACNGTMISNMSIESGEINHACVRYGVAGVTKTLGVITHQGTTCGSGGTTPSTTFSGLQGITIQPDWYINFNTLSLDTVVCRVISGSYTGSNAIFQPDTLTSNTISLTPSTNYYFNYATDYDPSYSGSLSPLYDRFGDIDYQMIPEIGDFIIFYYNDRVFGMTGYDMYPHKFMISNIDLDPIYNTLRFTISPEFPVYFSSDTINSYTDIVFTKRVPDETTMTLKGKKNPGQTSYGFVIPENINPTIQKNINILQSTIQSQILNY